MWFTGVGLAALVASVAQLATGETTRGFFLVALCFGVCAIGAWLDVATRRIPNALTYPALCIGLGINLIAAPVLGAAGVETAVVWSAAPPLRDALLGFALCAAIGVPSFAFRGLGGGDVKLLAAVGAMIGLGAVVPVLFNTLLVALFIGIGNLALRGSLVPRMQVIAGNLLVVFATRRMQRVYPFKKSESPFGLALLIGLVLSPFVAPHEFILSLAG